MGYLRPAATERDLEVGSGRDGGLVPAAIQGQAASARACRASRA